MRISWVMLIPSDIKSLMCTCLATHCAGYCEITFDGCSYKPRLIMKCCRGCAHLCSSSTSHISDPLGPQVALYEVVPPMIRRFLPRPLALALGHYMAKSLQQKYAATDSRHTLAEVKSPGYGCNHLLTTQLGHLPGLIHKLLSMAWHKQWQGG